MKDKMFEQILKMMSTMIPEEKSPENEISVFLSKKINEMIPEEEIAKLFRSVVIDYCNRDPETVYIKLVEFANDISELNESLKTEEEED